MAAKPKTKAELEKEIKEIQEKNAELTTLTDEQRVKIAALEADKIHILSVAKETNKAPAPSGKPGKRIKIKYLDDMSFHGTFPEFVTYLNASRDNRIREPKTVEITD